MGAGASLPSPPALCMGCAEPVQSQFPCGCRLMCQACTINWIEIAHRCPHKCALEAGGADAALGALRVEWDGVKPVAVRVARVDDSSGTTRAPQTLRSDLEEGRVRGVQGRDCERVQPASSSPPVRMGNTHLPLLRQVSGLGDAVRSFPARPPGAARKLANNTMRIKNPRHQYALHALMLAVLETTSLSGKDTVLIYNAALTQFDQQWSDKFPVLRLASNASDHRRIWADCLQLFNVMLLKSTYRDPVTWKTTHGYLLCPGVPSTATWVAQLQGDRCSLVTISPEQFTNLKRTLPTQYKGMLDWLVLKVGGGKCC